MRPLRDYLLIERTDPVTITEGGVHMPDTQEDLPSEGIVRMKGPRCTGEIPIGAKVRVSQYSGSEVKIEGVTYLIVNENFALIVLEEPEAV